MLSRSVVDPGDLPAQWIPQGEVLERVAAVFPMKINRAFFQRIGTPDDPLGRQVVPRSDELADLHGCTDPLSEEIQSPAPQVIHRYPHRVLLLVSNQCAVHCRFCMRKRRVADRQPVTRDRIAQGLSYIRATAGINEVILSGGDPLMLDDDTLADLLHTLKGVKHVRQVRIHTRIPAVLPQRITAALLSALARFSPLYVNIHCNHPDEISADMQAACTALTDAGIPLGSQSVLLKGVNDESRVLGRLFETLLAIRVRPYYLHQLDRVPGTAHFNVPLDKSLALMEALRGRISGMALPHFAVDLPGGGGKVTLTPDAIAAKGPAEWHIRNWRGDIYRYPI